MAQYSGSATAELCKLNASADLDARADEKHQFMQAAGESSAWAEQRRRHRVADTALTDR
jgi:hypothetical protein